MSPSKAKPDLAFLKVKKNKNKNPQKPKSNNTKHMHTLFLHMILFLHVMQSFFSIVLSRNKNTLNYDPHCWCVSSPQENGEIIFRVMMASWRNFAGKLNHRVSILFSSFLFCYPTSKGRLMKIQKAFIHVHSSIKSQRITGFCSFSQLATNLGTGVCFKFSVRWQL